MKIGADQGWISRIESGEVNPSWLNVWKLAEGLGVSVAHLSGLAEELARDKKSLPAE